MTLPATGALAFSDINIELGKIATALISLNDADVKTLFGVIGSNPVAFNLGFGKSNSQKKLIAIALGSPSIVIESLDGINWTQIKTSTTNLVSLFFKDNLIAVTCVSGVLFYSIDGGVNWLQSPVVTSRTIQSIIYLSTFNRYLISCGFSEMYYAPTLDAFSIAWTYSNPYVTSFNKMIIGNVANDLVVGVGDSKTGNKGTICSSVDGGLTWSLLYSSTVDYLTNIIFANGIYVAAGSNGYILTSTDLVTWTPRSVSSTYGAIKDICFGNGLFVIACDFNKILTSPDGITWTLRYAPPSGSQCCVFENDTFIVGGYSGVYYTSTDGITWTSHTATVLGTRTFKSIKY